MEASNLKTDEQKLVRDCLRQKSSSQKLLYERYSPRMMGLCYRYAKNMEDAQDILQEGFIKVFINLKQFRGTGSLEGWIRRIIVTTAINFIKKNQPFKENIEIENAKENATRHGAEHYLHYKDMVEAIRSLPTGYRTILNLYAIEGYSHKEIGEMLGIAESTSRSQYARAKNYLAGLIGKPENEFIKTKR